MGRERALGTGDEECEKNFESKHEEEEEEDDEDGSSWLLLLPLEVAVKRVLAREAEQPMTGKEIPKKRKSFCFFSVTLPLAGLVFSMAFDCF